MNQFKTPFAEYKARASLCYRCKHGAEPGEMRFCRCPGLSEAQRYQMPPLSVVRGRCEKYKPGKPE